MGEMRECGQKEQTSSYKIKSPGDGTYSMMTIVKSIVLCI